MQRGLPDFTTYGAVQLAISKMPESEKHEYHSCRHAFPHVPQQLHRSVRPDGIPGQYLHFTQLPSGYPTDPATGLAHTYQIIIRFDYGFQGMRKLEVQEAAKSRFEVMNIPLAPRYREPVSAIIHKESKSWLGFLRVDLLKPEIDGIDLLKGDRVFTLQLQNSEYVIGKVEKGFEFTSSAINRRLKLKSSILSSFSSRQLLGELTQLGYASGANLELIGVSKRTREQDTAEVTLASEGSKQYILEHPMSIAGHKITVTLPSSDSGTHLQSPDALTTSIMVKGLPLNVMQIQITTAIHRLLGPKNVISVSYEKAQDDELGRHDGSAMVRCLNAAVYTHWCNKKAVPLLGKNVDFSPHSRSISGSAPQANAYAQDRKPTREIIAEAITTLRNENSEGSSTHQIESSFQKVEQTITTSLQTAETHLIEHLNKMGTAVNNHTTATAERLTEQQRNNNTLLLHHVELLTSSSKALLQAQTGSPRGTLGLPSLPTNHE